MRYSKIIMVLVGVGFLLGCNHEPDDKSDKLLFEIPKAGYPVSVEASGDEKVDALVRQLVSKRPAPYPSGYWDAPEAVVFANRYSTPEVEAAIKSLKAMGPAVFPALVKHLGDDRYCYSDVWEAWLNHDVGDAVVEVLDDGHYLHSGYKFRETPSHSGGGYLSFEDYLHDRGAESWAEWAKSKLRLEIQMDFIDWCIAKENQRGYVDEAQKKQVLETYEAARLKVKKEYSKNDAPTNGGQPTRLETNQTSLGAGSRR